MDFMDCGSSCDEPAEPLKNVNLTEDCEIENEMTNFAKSSHVSESTKRLIEGIQEEKSKVKDNKKENERESEVGKSGKKTKSLKKGRDQDGSSGSEDEQDLPEQKFKKRRKQKLLELKKDWFLRVDSNGDSVGTYLRPVAGAPNKVFCSADSKTLNIGYRGFSAVQDHVSFPIHKEAMKIMKSQKSIGIYSEKYLATNQAKAHAEMKLLLYSTVRGV